MRTVMIIDDEPLIRRGLESMIPWETMGCCLIGQAVNGEEGLEKIRACKPEVVFTDIKMPKMDGIEMMREAMKEANPPVFVALSGYNDYELVRSAMRLGAIDYLMKMNLEEEELNRVLKEALDAAERKREKVSSETVSPPAFKEQFLKELLNLQGDKEFRQKMGQKEMSLEEGHFYRVLCLKPSEYSEKTWQDNTLTQNFLVNICKEQIPEETEVYEYRLAEGTFVLYMENLGILDKEVLKVRCRAMADTIKRYLNQEIRMGISGSHHNILHLPGALEEALQGIAFQISDAEKNIYFYTDLLNGAYFEEQLLRLKPGPEFVDDTENFLLQFQKFIMQKATIEESISICLGLMEVIYGIDAKSRGFFDQWFGKSYMSGRDFAGLKTPEDVSRWLLRLEQGIISFSQEYMGEIYRYKVKKAKEYIYENRFKKIGLNDVAAELEITPSYLSRIFKKVTRQSFSDYVAEVKVEEAKRLLLKDNNRIYEVSSLLGYDDPYYFSKVFKRTTQMTPSEFIARN